MIQLPFNCSCSKLNVHPQNWRSKKASTKKDWYITYRYYNSNGSSKLVMVKGMNHFKTVEERRQATERILQAEQLKLNNGYNPFLKNLTEIKTECENLDISGTTPFFLALTKAKKMVSGAETTIRDFRTVFNLIKPVASEIGLVDKCISLIGRKDIRLLLIQVEKKYGVSPHRYNKIRSYLMILYNQLLELEVIEHNPVIGIKKQKGAQKLRPVLTIEKRKLIDQFLKENHYRLWLFVHIFFHSGARLSELVNLKCSEVYLEDQYYIITIRKGKAYKQVRKPIKTIAKPFWLEAIRDGNKEDYVFSKGLKPGTIPIKAYQLTKRWNRHVKAKLGISEDLYSLKHLNLDETSSILSIEDAAVMASHASTVVTKRHYLINEEARQNERLKAVNNSFS